MRKANFPLRLQPSLLAEPRAVAEAEGVSVNQYISVTVAGKLASRRTAAEFFAARAKGGSSERALATLPGAPRRAGGQGEGRRGVPATERTPSG